MESASHFDVTRVEELIDAELYAQGIELLERIVTMLTKVHRSLIVQGVDQAPRCRSRVTSAATITGSITDTATTTPREGVREPHRKRQRRFGGEPL